MTGVYLRPLSVRFHDLSRFGLIVSAWLTISGSARGAGSVYDLALDFSVASNPNGAWSYGWVPTVGGPFTLMDTARTDEVPSVPIWSWSVGGFSPPDVHYNAGTNAFSADGGTFPPGSLWVCPGPEGTPRNFGVMRFTVPGNAAGDYRIEVAAEPYLGELSADNEFYVVRNGFALLSQFLSPLGRASFIDTLPLAAGDTIDLVVGRGQDGMLARSCLKLHAVLTSLVTHPPPPPPPSGANYDLSRDFSATSNPNGPWSYGYLPALGGDFGLLGAARTFGADNGVPIAVWELNTYQLPIVAKVLGPSTAHSDGDHFTAEPGTIYFAPGADGAPQNFGTIRFTVPTGAGGGYRIETSVRSLFDNARSRDADFHVLKNGRELFGQFLPPNSWTSYSNIVALAPGDTIDFAIGRGADGLTADTGLKIQAALVLLTNLPPPPGTNCVAPPPGLVAWWPFNGNLKDAVGSAALQLSGGPTFVHGKVNQALRFDGTNYEAVAAASAALNVGVAEGFSIETWVNPAHVTMQPLVEWSSDPSSSGVHFWLGVYGSGSIYANVVDVNGGQHSWRSDTDIVLPNVFQHVGMSYEKSSGLLRFYLDGRKVTEHFLGTFTPQTTYQMLVGYRRGQEHYAGVIDELSLYDRVLGDAEFAVIHAAGATGKCGANAPPPQQTGGYDLSRDFSGANNPNGAWSYGAKPTLNGPFSLFGIQGTTPADGGVPIQYWQLIALQEPTIFHNGTSDTATISGGQGTLPPGTTYLFSGTDGISNGFGAVRFTAPVAGQYAVRSSARPVWNTGLQGDTDYHVARNGVELFGRSLAGQESTSYSNILTLASGDLVDFMVGRGADGSGYGSGLKVEAVMTLVTNLPLPPTDCVVAPAGLLAWWRGEGDAMDSVGDNHGILHNGTGFTSGMVGEGFRFDGGDDFVLIPDNPTLDLVNEFSIELWFRREQPWVPNTQFTLFDKRDLSGHANYGATLSVNYGVILYFQDPQVGDFQILSYNPLPSTNVFHHFAGTYRQVDSEHVELQIYLDGQMVNSGQFPGSLANSLTATPLTLGSPRGASDFFEGVLDEISIYGRTLSSSEVLAIYNAGLAGKCHVSPPPPAGSSLIIPNELANADAAFGSGTLTNPAHRSQQVYGVSEFGSASGALRITELRFRPDYFYGRAFSATVSNIQINLSTTIRPAEGLSSTFADNIGADDTVVFSGALNVTSQFAGPASGPKAFDIRVPLSNPFVYNPAAGNLLVDIRNFSGSTASLLSGQGAIDGASRVLGSVNASTGVPDDGADALMILFTPSSSPPSPPVARMRISSGAVLALGQTNTIIISTGGSNIVAQFDGSLSSAAAGKSLDYHWFADGDMVPFATGVSISETFTLGVHVVTLLVNDGSSSDRDTRIFEVVTLDDAMSILASLLNHSGLPRDRIRPLRSSLNAVGASFSNGHLTVAIRQLEAFRQKVRAQVTPANPGLAAELGAAAKAIMDAVLGSEF